MVSNRISYFCEMSLFNKWKVQFISEKWTHNNFVHKLTFFISFSKAMDSVMLKSVQIIRCFQKVPRKGEDQHLPAISSTCVSVVCTYLSQGDAKGIGFLSRERARNMRDQMKKYWLSKFQFCIDVIACHCTGGV